MAVWILGKMRSKHLIQHLSLKPQQVAFHLTTATMKTVRQLPVTPAPTFLSPAFIHVSQKEKSRVFSRNTAMLKVVLS